MKKDKKRLELPAQTKARLEAISKQKQELMRQWQMLNLTWDSIKATAFEILGIDENKYDIDDNANIIEVNDDTQAKHSD